MSDRPFRGSAAVAAGTLTRAQLRASRFRRLCPDVYVAATATVDLRLRSLAAYLLVEQLGGVLGGFSAAELLGASRGPLGTPADVVVDRYVRPSPGICFRRQGLRADEIVVVDGCRVTTSLRTAWDLARRLPTVEAVVSLDALARAGRFAPDVLLTLAAGQPGARGRRAVAAVVDLADPRAESPMETRMRLLIVGAGLPAPTPQFELVENRRVVARFDLAYPELRLGIEYDGDAHVDRLDRRRDMRTGRLGWHTIRLTRTDILGTPTPTAANLRAVYAARSALFATSSAT